MNSVMQVFDRRAVRRHRDRAAGTVDAVADILGDAAGRLLDRLDDISLRFTRALDVGGRGVVAPLLRARGIETFSSDLSPAMAARAGAPAVAADEEYLPFAPASFDLVVASLSLHWVNDLPGALIQLRMALRPDGLLLASLPALGTLAELRAALTGTEAALTVADVEDIFINYADPFALLRDLRAAGEANAVALRDRRTPPRALFPAALAALPRSEGRVPATLRLAILTGWAPAPSQPQPLARGSATASLADFLESDGQR
jgi:SAM-dependent methyltransferase